VESGGRRSPGIIQNEKLDSLLFPDGEDKVFIRETATGAGRRPGGDKRPKKEKGSIWFPQRGVGFPTWLND